MATGQSATIPAPILGLNARDGLGDMDARFGIVLDNVIAQNGSVDVRGGTSEHATGMSDAVESLIPWNGPSSNKLFAVNAGNIYNVTTNGAVGAADVSGLSNSRFQYQNISTSGGNFVFVVNGADAPRHYNGSTWATPSITGITASNANNVYLHANRLWLALNGDINAYYLPTSAIAGAATQFPLGAVFREGGSLQAMISISRDSGAGMDDYLAFISSNGEVAIYQGTDPSSADTWALVGLYRTGRPIGKRCAFKYAADGVVITEDGIVSLSKLMANDRYGQVALTDIINQKFNLDARTYGSQFGWQGLIYPRGKWLIINVPQMEGEQQVQYIMNTVTGAWSTFSNINANCFAISGDDIYFGGNDGRVMIADSGYADDGENINFTIKTSYQYFGFRGIKKFFKMIQPLFGTSGTINFGMGINVDFADTAQPTYSTGSLSSGWSWGDAWGSIIWGGGNYVRKVLKGLNKSGNVGSVVFSGSTRGSSVSVYSFDIVFERGSIL